MARISKEYGDAESFVVYGEAALDIDPFDTKLRFNVAYTYSDIKNEKLALLHFHKLTKTIQHAMGQNNLGASYSILDLKGKSIANLLKAAEMNNTLSMGNLAHKYLEVGFIKHAQELIDKANGLSKGGIEANQRIANAQKTLKGLQESENKREKELLLAAEEERKFRVKYANAFCSNNSVQKNDIEGSWETPWGNGQLTFNEEANSFEIDISIEKVDAFASLTAALTGNQGKQEEVHKTEYHNIKGRVNNLSGKYTIDAKETGTTIMTKGVEYAATGYMLIDEGSNSIDVMEKTKDGKNEFKQWKKLKN